MSVDYLLHESSVGYAVFQVVHQADTIGNRLKEVQDAVQVWSLEINRHTFLEADWSAGPREIWKDG